MLFDGQPLGTSWDIGIFRFLNFQIHHHRSRSQHAFEPPANSGNTSTFSPHKVSFLKMCILAWFDSVRMVGRQDTQPLASVRCNGNNRRRLALFCVLLPSAYAFPLRSQPAAQFCLSTSPMLTVSWICTVYPSVSLKSCARLSNSLRRSKDVSGSSSSISSTQTSDIHNDYPKKPYNNGSAAFAYFDASKSISYTSRFAVRAFS